MSIHIKGFISSKNETYKKHSEILIACIQAGIKELPKETAEYFGSKCPNKDLLEEKLKIEVPITECSNNHSSGVEIIVSEIPEGVCKIIFTKSCSHCS